MKTINIEIPEGFEIDKEKSTFTNVVLKPIEKKWIDLGLPSGTLWCDTNENGYYCWDKMMETFDKESLPRLTDFAELLDCCTYKWDSYKGITFIGPNGNHLFFPADGSRSGRCVDGKNYYGAYWSSIPGSYYSHSLYFDCGIVNMSYDDRVDGCSVRLIKRK